MENFNQEMNVINLQIAKCYKIYDELSIEDQLIVKQELPEFYNAMKNRDIVLINSNLNWHIINSLFFIMWKDIIILI